MARQDNPFALLEDDDEGSDVSVLLAKVEAKIPVLLPVIEKQSKPKVHELPSKLPSPTDFEREERGRGRGGRGRGPGRGGFGDVGGFDSVSQTYNGYYRGYSGESGGGRSRGRGSRGGVGRGRGFAGFVNRDQLDYDNLGGVEEGGERLEKVSYDDWVPLKYETRKFVEEKQGKGVEERDRSGFREYDGRENRGFMGYGGDVESREFVDGEGHEERYYGGDKENRGFRGGAGYEGRSYGGDRENRGFRGEGRGRVYGGRGRRGGRDGEYGGAQYESNGRWNASESKDITSDEKYPISDSTNTENEGFGRENHGFRGGEGRGRVYGARGRRGGRDGEYGGTQYESNGRWNASETKDITLDEKYSISNNTNIEDEGVRSADPSAAENPKNEQLEKPVPEQISSEDTSKVVEEDKEMTLAEYEKLLQEKRKALESLKVQSRKVVLDKDFEGMQIVEKKKEHDDLIKMRSDSDKGKKKETSEREEKSRKSLSINEFLKPADGERYRGPPAARGRGGRGRGRGGGYTSDYSSQAAAPPLEDPSHFPVLGPVAKA